MSANLDAQLKKLEKSAKFQKQVAQARKNAAMQGTTFGQGDSAVSKAFAVQKCRRMRELLYEETVKVIPPINLHDIEIGEIEVDGNGNFIANIGFNRAAARRESLYLDKYNGVENIFLHFTHGWDANAHVYGSWHGNTVQSRAHFDGDDFIQRAVDRFNAEMQGGATVEIDPMYL